MERLEIVPINGSFEMSLKEEVRSVEFTVNVEENYSFPHKLQTIKVSCSLKEIDKKLPAWSESESSAFFLRFIFFIMFR